jgi:uncharacterized protein
MPARRKPTRRVTWVVKASKLCNLRCRYCYEWNELSRRERISLEQWRRLLVAMQRYHDSLTPRFRVETQIVWHGGEPLLLPTDYFTSVMALQREILGADRLAAREFVNSLQTNLYAVDDAKLEMLARERIALGISLDLAPGVRLTAGGAETEDRVTANMDRLTAAGIDFGAIVVLARHTLPMLREIYDFYESLRVDIRVLPLFDAPLNVPGSTFTATNEEMLAALQGLFVYWMKRKCRIEISPFDLYLETVHLQMLGQTRALYDRRAYGEYILLVNTDGALYERRDAYDPTRSLGNVFTQDIDEVLGSPAYGASLDRDETLTARYCDECEYLYACDRSPLFESPRAFADERRCQIAYPMHRFIAGYVSERRMTPKQVARILAAAGAS